jgi:hypothetical protein
MTPWEFKAREFVNCNCDYGCPCQFNALPTHGSCEAIAGMELDEGHYGDVDLRGLRLVTIFYWPGAVHEGNGKCQVVIDERANEAQRAALLKIVAGEDTDPFATMFAVFASTVTELFDPIYAPIDFAMDVDGRTGHLSIPGLATMKGEPIRNPVTGDVHRARIDLPRGFEYALAEIGSGTSKCSGNIPLELTNSHGHFAALHLNNHGIVRS